MDFAALYNHVNGLTGNAISVKDVVRPFITAHHSHVGQVNFWPLALNPEISLGHIKYERDRDSPYEEEFTVANIRYDKNLNRCWRRFVCCKELMHVFDTEDERVNTRERFVRLLTEFESPPVSGDMSRMFLSEFQAQWMAIMILCPQRVRDQFKPAWLAKTISSYDIALKAKIPEHTINGLMSEYYDTALQRLVG